MQSEAHPVIHSRVDALLVAGDAGMADQTACGDGPESLGVASKGSSCGSRAFVEIHKGV